MTRDFLGTGLVVAMAAGVSLLALAASSPAEAGAFGLREQSAAGQGASFAGAAAGAAGLGSMFWNPAAITMAPGIQTSTTLSFISPYAKFQGEAVSSPLFRGANSGDVGEEALLSSSYGSWQVNDKVWLGYQLTAPFGLATKPDQSFTGRAYGNTTKVISVEFAPTVGYQINEMISVGASLRVLYFKARYTSAIPGLAPVANWQPASLEGDDVNVGFSLGTTITPMPGTSIGIGYRSMVEETLSGDFRVLGTVTPFKATAVLPDQVTVGVRQAIGDKFTALAGVEWTNWSRLGFPRVVNQNTGGLLAAQPTLPLNYKDGWFFSVGGEYAVTPEWTVRAGLAYEVSPIDDNSRNLRLPDNDRIWASLGASYKWSDRISFDLGYTHIFPQNTKIAIQPGSPTYNPLIGPMVGNVDAHIDIVSLAWRFRWDDPSKTIPVLQTVKAKY